MKTVLLSFWLVVSVVYDVPIGSASEPRQYAGGQNYDVCVPRHVAYSAATSSAK
jgi:hypothetical protein